MENQEKVNYIYGMHPVLEAINAGKNIDKVYLKSGLEGESFRQLLSLPEAILSSVSDREQIRSL